MQKIHTYYRFVVLIVLIEMPLIAIYVFAPRRCQQSLNIVRKSRNEQITQLERHGWRFPAVYIGNSTLTTKRIWTSQVGQDNTIASIFDGKKNGYFVDLAANDAVSLSNTFALEQKFDWNGLCIEPNYKYFPGLLQRKCQVVGAVVGRSKDEPVTFTLDGVYSGITGEEFDNLPDPEKVTMAMKATTVEQIFRDFDVPPVIDYLSLDIEGAEMWAFEHFPWHKYTFLTLTVERPKRLAEILKRQGYVYLKEHGWFGDELWIHNSLPNFEEVFSRYKDRRDTT